MNTPTYQDINAALAHAHYLITPAELHGLLCGLICAGLKKLDSTAMQDILILNGTGNEVDPSTTALLNTLFHETQTKIQEFELDFQLLLPDENRPLNERAQELGKWCDGFLAGMGLAHTPAIYHDDSEVADILHKLSQAAKIPFHLITFAEEDEMTFIEITEFVRLSVFTIYQELVGPDQPPLKDSEDNPTYH